MACESHLHPNQWNVQAYDDVAVGDIPFESAGQCPKCGNTDQASMNVARRTCGYIGTQYWNQGRTQEIRDRVLHL